MKSCKQKVMVLPSRRKSVQDNKYILENPDKTENNNIKAIEWFNLYILSLFLLLNK